MGIDFVAALGVTVYYVPGLVDVALYVEEGATLFIRAGLTDAERRRICDDVLGWIEPLAS